LKRYVIDASVAMRFVLTEDLSDKALLILEDFKNGISELIAPKLIEYEVGNALWMAAIRNIIKKDDAEESIFSIIKFGIGSINLNSEEAKNALKWSIENKITYYDSVYVLASKKVKAIFITADDKLYNCAKKEVPTISLRDYPKLEYKNKMGELWGNSDYDEWSDVK
jgi:predicted nucleic acid-binding protein